MTSTKDLSSKEDRLADDGSNFQTWKKMMVVSLISKRCYTVVKEGLDPAIQLCESSESGESTEDEDLSEKKAKKRAKRLQKSSRSPYKDNKAQALILKSVGVGEQDTPNASPVVPRTQGCGQSR